MYQRPPYSESVDKTTTKPFEATLVNLKTGRCFSPRRFHYRMELIAWCLVTRVQVRLITCGLHVVGLTAMKLPPKAAAGSSSFN